MIKFEVGDLVQEIPEYALAVSSDQTVDPTIHKVTRVQNDHEDRWTVYIWLDDDPNRRDPVWYRRIGRTDNSAEVDPDKKS